MCRVNRGLLADRVKIPFDLVRLVMAPRLLSGELERVG
jgi:hypothetical protein